MLPTSRNAAIAAGSRFFNTGRPCRNGHTSNRYTSTGNCLACVAAARDDKRSLIRQTLAAKFEGADLFTYRLHPDDHAAALAYCQGLDLQRGRMPQLADGSRPGPAPVQRVELPASIARARALLPPEVYEQHDALPRINRKP